MYRVRVETEVKSGWYIFFEESSLTVHGVGE